MATLEGKHGVCGEHFLLGAIQRNEHESNVYQVFTTCREPHMPKRVSGNSKLGWGYSRRGAQDGLPSRACRRAEGLQLGPQPSTATVWDPPAGGAPYHTMDRKEHRLWGQTVSLTTSVSALLSGLGRSAAVPLLLHQLNGDTAHLHPWAQHDIWCKTVHCWTFPLLILNFQIFITSFTPRRYPGSLLLSLSSSSYNAGAGEQRPNVPSRAFPTVLGS